MFKTTLLAACALVAGAIFSTTASAQGVTVNGAKPDTTSHPANPATQDNSDATAPELDPNASCPRPYEDILPGDYYACEARLAYARGKNGKTLEWLEEAAYWANKDAQHALGLMYINGDVDVEQNIPLGVAWLALAAERKNQQYQLDYAAMRARITPQEDQQATKLWQQLRRKYGDNVAEKRAIRRFNRSIADIDDAARGDGIVYLSGYAPFPQSAFVIANKLHDQAAADFGTYTGDVVVGKPQWLHDAPPAGAASAAPAPAPAPAQ
jgi:hypothetical protein